MRLTCGDDNDEVMGVVFFREEISRRNRFEVSKGECRSKKREQSVKETLFKKQDLLKGETRSLSQKEL